MRVCWLHFSAFDYEPSFTTLLPPTVGADLRRRINHHLLQQTRLTVSHPFPKFISTVKAVACLIITVSTVAVIVSTQEGLSEVLEIGFLCCISSLPIYLSLYSSVFFFHLALIELSFLINSTSFPNTNPPPSSSTSHLCPFIFLHDLISCIYSTNSSSPCLC